MLEEGYYQAKEKPSAPKDPEATDGTMCGHQRAAFLSVANKTPEIAAFAGYLHDSLGLVLYGSDGTAKFLDGMYVPCQNYATIGAPPMFSHGVVSLHPRVMGALIARKDKPEHMAQLVEIDAPCCEVFVGGFYDLDVLIAEGTLSFEDICDKIDVGGPAQAVGGAKRGRIVIVDEADIPAVWEEMKASNGEVSEATRRHLCGKALAMVAQHYLTAAEFISGGEYTGIICEKVRLPRPEDGDQAPAAMLRSLRKSSSTLALHRFEVVSGGPGM